jgi:ATP-dependent DNA helicase RecG
LHSYSPHFYSRIGGAVDGAIPKDNDGAIDEATMGVKQKLSTLLRAIAAHEGNRAPEYITAIGVSEKTMERYLQQLKEAGLIEFKGEAAQTGGYYLTKKMKGKLK